MIQASFAGSTWKPVSGYVISAVLDLLTGIGNEYYITLFVRNDAATPLVGRGMGDNPESELRILGDGRQYSFNPVKITRFVTSTTRRERTAIIEFQANWNGVTAPTIQAQSADERALAELPSLKKDYTLALDGGTPEQLLGFEAALSDMGEPVYRFVTLSNRQNRWHDRILGIGKAILAGGEPEKNEIKVGFSQSGGQPLSIRSTTTRRIAYAEVYGACLSWPVYPLSELASTAPLARGARVLPPDRSFRELLEHEEQAGRPLTVLDRHTTVEIAAPLFHAGHYHDLAFR